jgi:hypothetical protein
MLLPQKLPFRLKLALVVLFVLAAGVIFFPAVTARLTMYVDKVSEIPDIKQTDRSLNFPEHGRDFCAPVAVTDSFAWLYRHGYDRIFGAGTDEAALRLSACRKLAELMCTRNGPGTTSEDFLAGLKRYIQECTPYSIRSLKYQGWNRHEQEYDCGRAAPELDWIKAGVRGDNSAWINIGWYEKDARTGELRRVDGHWVVLVGYGMDTGGVANASTLIVRDPDPVLSDEPRKIFLTVEPLAAGTLTGPQQGLPRPAAGYLQIKSMGNVLDTSRKRLGIIDGAIVLELWPSWLNLMKDSR